MKGLKKITCAALAAAVAASMTGCSLDASWIAKSGETKLPSGVYAAYVLQDVMYGYMMSGSTYLDQEGLSESLVEDAKAYCTELLAYQCKADEMGITLTEEEKAEAGLIILLSYTTSFFINFFICSSSILLLSNNVLE